MPNRFLKESICTSENIDALDPFEECFFYRLIVNCDDFGRFDGRLKVLSAKLFPLKSISTDKVEKALSSLAAADLIIRYDVDGKPYIQITTWLRHQSKRATKSKWPAPPEGNPIKQALSEEENPDQMPTENSDLKTIDSNCEQSQANDSKCPRIRIRNSYSYSYSDKDAPTPFERFWMAYPKKVGKGAAEKAFAKYKPDDDLTDRMIRAVETAKRTDQWRRDGGQYIPNPSTWLNQRRWEDELPITAPKQTDDRGLEDWGAWTEGGNETG